MCGISGALQLGVSGDEWRARLQKMAEVIIHRGPDDEGIWFDAEPGIGFAHRRLSVIDLSIHGHQPMHSSSGRYVIISNGEIYNFNTLRRELKGLGHIFRGHSDTEVLTVAVEAWGIEQALKRFNGMFAFALWDKLELTLTLARDRMGEKPLYYCWQGTSFLFGSELRALRTHPDWQGEIDRDALALYMRHSCIPAPYSIYQGICKLMPGTILQLSANLSQDKMPVPQAYWQAKSVAEYGINHPLEKSEDQAVDALDNLLRETIREKMISDVPLGAFLSGGIDSSTVVALMQAESTMPVKTFTIGFHEDGYNEAEQAKVIAEHLGTEHTELYVTAKQAMDVIPRLPQLYDEPFSDSSQVPTFMVSEMTKQHVTVALSGDGGDELFGGYHRHYLGEFIWNRIRFLPSSFRVLVAICMQGISPQSWNKFFSHLDPVLPTIAKHRLPGDKLHKLADVLAVSSPEEMYCNLVSHWKNPSSLVLGSKEPLTAISDPQRWANLPEFAQRMMFMDMISYLPDDILVKVDRAAMSVSLETRVPFLDHRIVEFAWRVPQSMKIREGQGKWLLREVLYRYVPKEMIERPKMGFGMPIGKWLRGPLRDWAESLISKKRLSEEGFFNPTPIRQKWTEHLSGKRNWQHLLWDVLMFQAWLEVECA